MPRKILLVLFAFFVLFTSSCGQNLPNIRETEAQPALSEPATEEKEPTAEPTTEDVFIPTPSTTTAPTTTTKGKAPTTTTSPPKHVHAYQVVLLKKASCSSAGERSWRCSCGDTIREYLPALAHNYTQATCTAPATCTSCGKEDGIRLGHRLLGNHCSRCDKTIETPIYVLGTELPFDASRGDIEAALGAPTEVITEGDFVSLVYASDLSRLTVIQTDAIGLWGMFSVDPSLSLFFGEIPITLDNFSGAQDLSSDAYYRDEGSCRVFGFKDSLGSGKFYGIWMRYSECRYDYMNDPAIYSSFEGQSRLSWYYTNALRVKNGLSPLLWSDAAAKVARDYSATMADNNYLDHDGSFGHRLRNEGIFWRTAGENISRGYYNLFFVCDAYYNSDGHRKNILHSDFSHVGMGYYQLEGRDVYGAQIFYGL